MMRIDTLMVAVDVKTDGSLDDAAVAAILRRALLNLGSADLPDALGDQRRYETTADGHPAFVCMVFSGYKGEAA